MSTGMPRDDAKADFARERRRRALARIVSRLRSEPDDVSYMLPFEEVVAALGRTSEHDLGVQLIPLESVVGTVDRATSQFDRDFRPSADVRARWERIAAARRRGEAMPPIDVYRVGDLHFVKDGHHRVSVARAHGDVDIEARVREVRTKLGAEQALRLRDLPLKQHERMFHERVPLAPEQRARIQLDDEWRYAQLGMLVEAWAYRASHERGPLAPEQGAGTQLDDGGRYAQRGMLVGGWPSRASHERGELLSRHEMAQRWFKEEYEPIAQALADADAGGEGSETEKYMRLAMLRYLLLHTHEWTDEILGRLLGEARNPSADLDTMVHQFLKEMR